TDFARLIARVLEFPTATVRGKVFNAGCDANNHTKQSIIELIQERLPNRRVRYCQNSPDPRNYRVSFEKVRTELGFVPRMSVADGIDELIWALSVHMFDDVAHRQCYYANCALPGLELRSEAPFHAAAGNSASGPPGQAMPMPS